MRRIGYYFALGMIELGVAASQGQQPAPNFQPGEWQINSVTTVTNGRTISSQTNLCAKTQADFWNVKQDGMKCDAPKITPAQSGGLRIRVVCTYSLDNLNSRIESDVIEQIAADGKSFTATGTTKTNTTYTGVAPKITSAQLDATANRTGPCT
ncbi:MAG TPA: DUF3617 family protein [Acidobacteriaceae bacterium]|nr:DUF3617 family protein [Acidobacteriaceae bacterium]